MTLKTVLLASNQREITPDDVSMVTAMRRSHWMRGPNVLSNGWLSSIEFVLNHLLPLQSQMFIIQHVCLLSVSLLSEV